jgi:hypothetical protein
MGESKRRRLLREAVPVRAQARIAELAREGFEAMWDDANGAVAFRVFFSCVPSREVLFDIWREELPPEIH